MTAMGRQKTGATLERWNRAVAAEILYTRGLSPLPKTESNTRMIKTYREQFEWPLAFAILLLLVEMCLPASKEGKR
jgi:hypothetical protein